MLTLNIHYHLLKKEEESVSLYVNTRLNHTANWLGAESRAGSDVSDVSQDHIGPWDLTGPCALPAGSFLLVAVFLVLFFHALLRQQFVFLLVKQAAW